MGERLPDLRSKDENGLTMTRDELEAEFLRRLAAADMEVWRRHAAGQYHGDTGDEYDEETRRGIGQMKRVHRLKRLIKSEAE